MLRRASAAQVRTLGSGSENNSRSAGAAAAAPGPIRPSDRAATQRTGEMSALQCQATHVTVSGARVPGSRRAAISAGTASLAGGRIAPNELAASQRTRGSGSARAFINGGTTSAGSARMTPSASTAFRRTSGLVSPAALTSAGAAPLAPLPIWRRARAVSARTRAFSCRSETTKAGTAGQLMRSSTRIALSLASGFPSSRARTRPGTASRSSGQAWRANPLIAHRRTLGSASSRVRMSTGTADLPHRRRSSVATTRCSLFCPGIRRYKPSLEAARSGPPSFSR